MVDLFKWNDEKKHQQWRKVMEDAGVFLPKDFDELEKIIKS